MHAQHVYRRLKQYMLKAISPPSLSPRRPFLLLDAKPDTPRLSLYYTTSCQ